MRKSSKIRENMRKQAKSCEIVLKVEKLCLNMQICRTDAIFVPSTKVCCHFWGGSAKSFLVQHAAVKKDKKDKKKIFESKATVFL